VLRLNESAPGCGLLGSHDDFSVTSHLPADTAVVTQLRCSPIRAPFGRVRPSVSTRPALPARLWCLCNSLSVTACQPASVPHSCRRRPHSPMRHVAAKARAQAYTSPQCSKGCRALR